MRLCGAVAGPIKQNCGESRTPIMYALDIFPYFVQKLKKIKIAKLNVL